MDDNYLLGVFDCEIQCEYKGRQYLVRDNGAIMRLPKKGARFCKYDNVWTFGNKDPKTGYMLLSSSIRVHQVVCTAFHGPRPQPGMVVDHIDTNRCNNRPENLMWVTKLENILLNPITRAKVELICGSIENFLSNPKLLSGHESENLNFTWMRAVTKEEAAFTLKRWAEWAAKPLEDRKSKGNNFEIGEWVYSNTETSYTPSPEEEREVQEATRWNGFEHLKYDLAAIRQKEYERQLEMDFGLKDSLTPGAKQLNWKTLTEFLLCPKAGEDVSLSNYLMKLSKDSVFSRNEYGESMVVEAGYNPDNETLYVLTTLPSPIKPFAICKIFIKDDAFVHESLGSFFREDGGRKSFTLAMDQEWTGGDVFDDYCS